MLLGEVERLDQEDLGNSALNEESEKNAKRRGSCALAELLGNTFGAVRQAPGLAPPEKSAHDRAEEEVKDCSAAATLPLPESPLDWWKSKSPG